MPAAIILALLMQQSPSVVTSATRLPVTIRVTKDVLVTPDLQTVPRLRGVLYVYAMKNGPVVIKAGQTFQMIKDTGEGNCRFRFQGQTFESAFCSWMDGFTDHRGDIFVVVSGRR